MRFFAIFSAFMFLLFFTACDGNSGKKADADTPGNDSILTDEDLVTDELIPDEEEDVEPDETDLDIKDADIKDGDIVDKDIIDTDTTDEDLVEVEPTDDGEPTDESEVEPDTDEVVLGPCAADPCAAIAHTDGTCTEVGEDFVCGCLENYLWDEQMKECLAATQVVACTNTLPDNGHWAAPNEDGMIEQVWDGDSWEPPADTCAWECDANYDKQGETCVAGVRRVDCENAIPDHAVYAGANADGKFEQVWDGDSWEPATFDCEWACALNYTWDGSLCVADTQRVDCTNIPANAHGTGDNADGKIDQVWDGDSWEPPADTCTWECDEHYLQNGNLCEPETRREWCTNIPLEHAHGTGDNADGMFEQVWDGDSWEPATFDCTWECDTNYTWDGAVCAADTQRVPCTNIPANAHGIGDNADGKFEQVWDGDSWEPATFDCAWECNEHYTWDGSLCVADTQRVDCTNIPANAHGTGDNADGQIDQTWDGDSWEPAADTCTWECDYQYLWNEGTGTCELRPIVYVNHAATGMNTGYSWEDAFTDLTTALENAVAGQEIWVAMGTYVPSKCLTTAQETCDQRPRNRTFTLPAGVAIYGGFAGTETSRDERDWETNQTILSGDLNDDDMWDDVNEVWLNREENAYHVVQLIVDNKFSADGILDGFTIIGGNADATDPQGIEGAGGGLQATDNADSAGEPIVRNCTFRDNYAAGGGGGASFMNMDPVIENCTFIDNHADFGGGGLSVANGTATVTTTDFMENSTDGSGGAIWLNNGSSLNITDAYFIHNEATSSGSAIASHDSDLTLYNCFFDVNAVTGTGNYDGGTIALNFGTLDMSYGTLHQNISSIKASAMSLNTVTANIDHVEFIWNASSDSGDQMKTFNVRESTLSISDAMFTDNMGTPLSLQGSGATVERTVFSNNHAVNAGAVSCNGEGSLTINACRFEGNAADQPGSGFVGIGGALFLNGMSGTPSVTIVNSLFDSNHANFWGGAATFLMVAPTVINCTFEGNTAGVDGDGIAFVGSNALVNNAIIWDEVIQITSAGPYTFPPSNPTFSYSDVQGSGGSGNTCGGGSDPCWVLPFGTDGGGNIDADPLFVGGTGSDPLDLQSGSPCIDTGSNDLVPENLTVDILGDPRIQNETVDMGAYEQ